MHVKRNFKFTDYTKSVLSNRRSFMSIIHLVRARNLDASKFGVHHHFLRLLPTHSTPMSFSASESKTAISKASKGSAISFLDWLKPRRSVAIARLRHNGFALAVALIFTQLAPVVPSPLSCLFMVLVDDRGLTKAEAWMCRIGESIYLWSLLPSRSLRIPCFLYLFRTGALFNTVIEYFTSLSRTALSTTTV